MERTDVAYGVAGLVIGLAIVLVSVDLLLGGRISAVFGKPPGLSLVTPPASDDEAVS